MTNTQGAVRITIQLCSAERAGRGVGGCTRGVQTAWPLEKRVLWYHSFEIGKPCQHFKWMPQVKEGAIVTDLWPPVTPNDVSSVVYMAINVTFFTLFFTFALKKTEAFSRNVGKVFWSQIWYYFLFMQEPTEKQPLRVWPSLGSALETLWLALGGPLLHVLLGWENSPLALHGTYFW